MEIKIEKLYTYTTFSSYVFRLEEFMNKIIL